MRQQDLLDHLLQEVRHQSDPPINLAAIEANVMEKIAQQQPPRFPPAAPPRRSRWIPLTFVIGAAALFAIWHAVPVPVPAPQALPYSFSSTIVEDTGEKTLPDRFHTNADGKLVKIPRMATIWVEPGSQGDFGIKEGQLSVNLEEGAVSLDAQPQPAPDRIQVIAGNLRVSVKGTKFRVARHAEQVDVDVEHGAVQVTSLDGSDPSVVLQGPVGGSFPSGKSGPIRGLRSFVVGPLVEEKPDSKGATAVASTTVSEAAQEPTATTTTAGPVAPPQYSLQQLYNQATTLASSCTKASSNVAQGVVVTVETTLTMTIRANGRADTFFFSPPLSPNAEQCFQDNQHKLRGPAGSHRIPLVISLGDR